MKRSLAIVALAVVGAAVTGCGTATVGAEHHLVFVRATDPRNATVWIADANGHGAHRLTRGYAAAVAPNGRTIAVGRWDGIHLISSDGKHERRLTPKNRWPEAWSPDGKWIVAMTDFSLAVVDVDSRRTRVVAHGLFYGFGLSPDGHSLVYARAPRKGGEDICTVRPDLYSVRLAGGRPLRLTTDGRSAFPVLGRQRIAFMRLPNLRHFSDCFAPGIWTMRDDGTDIRPIVARAPRTLARAGYYGLQPVAWLGSRRLLVGVRSEWGNEAATLDLSTKRLRRLAICSGGGSRRTCAVHYVDKGSRDGRLALGEGGNEMVTISIIRVSNGQPTFTLHGNVCCPDWNR